jgi:phage terminase small subunit
MKIVTTARKLKTLANLSPGPPKGLTAGARDRWQELQNEYRIEDAGGLSILRLHVEALMTAQSAEEILRRDGMTTVDRFGQARAHPAAVILRDARSQMLATLRALNLDVLPPKGGA